ncbi:hypothetical protein WN48_04343, partial [Eufriesea mexicana]
ILKTPKARQPLQNLNFNSSSNENSPTITSKIKRRVSFAEKKHVKEFCNSLEQGTVWDNTYEEHDISNLKIPCSNQEECVPENVYKENIFCSTNENDIQSVCNTIIRKNYNVEDCNLYHMNAIEDLNYQDKILSELSVPCHGGTAQGNESTSLTDLQLKDDNYISKDIVVYEDLDVCETSTNHNRTRICNDETMEFTTAATTLSAEHQNNFQMPIRSTFYIQPNSSNSVFNNDRSHSNRTIIFHDNSMTITNVLSSLDTRHNYFSIYSNNATKDICTNASAAISCSLNSDTILSKENYIINNSSKAIENNAMEKSTPIKVQSSANVKPSMALHESEQQDAFASALKENNTEIACATLNSVLNDSSSSANLELNKDKNVVDKYTETIISHPRRTYTICSLSNDRTFTVDNKKNNNISEINNDILYKLNDEEHNAHNIFNNTENLQNEEDYDRQHLMDKSDIFSNKSLEDLESIKPPSFCCSDNFSDLSMNIIHNQEINTEANYLLKYENREQEGTQKIENCKANVLEEIVRESRTFLIKRVCLYNAPDSLRFEQENQTQNGKIQKLDLLNKKDTDTEIQVLACLSSSVSDTDKFSMVSNANLQNLDNSNLENKNIKYSSPNTSVIDENTSKVDDYNKLLDTNMVEANNESYSNEKLRLSLEPRTSYVEENITTELDTFCLLMDELKIRAKRY